MTDERSETPPQASRGRLLLVEDDPVSTHAYTLLFQKGGFEVVHTADGQDALEALFHTDFAVVILDLVLPQRDGMEVLDKMRAMPRHEFTPTIVLTSADLAMARRAAREKGVMQFLTKGQTTPAQLLSIVEEVATVQPPTDSQGLRMVPPIPPAKRLLKDQVLDAEPELPKPPAKPKSGLFKKLFFTDEET